MPNSFLQDGPIAQMNWGRMKYAPGHPKLADFEAALERVYGLAEQHPGFIWRISDNEIAEQLLQNGFDERTSATVSVWRSYEELHDYSFNTEHGSYLDRKDAWFEPLDGQRLVIWNVSEGDRPDFNEALRRLNRLNAVGPSAEAFGWL